MKKILAAILAVLLLLSLCACDKIEKLSSIELPELPRIEPPASPEPQLNTSEAKESVPSPAISPEARVIVSITETDQQFFDPAEGTTEILDFSYETPHIDISGRDAAADAINEYAAKLDEAYCTGNGYEVGTGSGLNMMLEMATDNFTYAYTSGQQMNLLMSSNRTVSIKRSDSAVLSLLYKTSVYTGGAHGGYGYTAYVFDTENGERITLDTLTSDRAALEAAALAKMKAVIAEEPDAYFSPSDEQLLALLREGSWFLDETGLVIFPDVYELASYAAGVTFFEIPYGELKGILNEKWFPKSFTGIGEMTLISQQDFQNGSMEVIDKVTANKGGEELCLVADGIVFDVRILRVSYMDYNKTFMETAQLWQSSYMENCAVQLQATIPEGMPDLMVSWRTAEGQELRRLVTCGENGGAALTGDDISAVG